MLINGFGIERKESYEVYSKNLMPNMDQMTKTYLFSSLIANAGDYNNGYKSFSMSDSSSNKEDYIDELIFEKTLGNNETIKEINSNLTNENKLHIFYTLNDGSKLHQIKELIKILNPKKDKKIYIHPILIEESTKEYPNIIKAVSKLAFETGGYAKIGFVVGREKINTDDVLRTIYKEFGEHWNESARKFEVLQRDIINPKDAGVFYINSGFSLSENDVILFANFIDVECDKFYDEISKMKLHKYSLYPFRDDFASAFVRETGNVSSLSDITVKHGIKMLILTDTSRINELNYYLNGMKRELCANITYAEYDASLFSSKENVISLVENNEYDGIILDFDIGSLIDLAKIKQTLNSIDTIIKPISEASQENDYTFIISSNYGMHAQVNDGVVTRVIDFAGKVPCIYQNNEFDKKEYTLSGGTTHDLALTFLTNICDEVKSNKIVKKLSGLDKALSKKR